MNARFKAVGILIVLAAALGVWAMLPPREQARSGSAVATGPEHAEGENQRLQQRVDEQEAKLAALTRKLEAQEQREPLQGAEPQHDVQPVPLSPRPEDTMTPPQVAGALTALLREETVDRKWGAELAERARAVVAPLSDRVRIAELHCGSTFCRMILSHAEAARVQQNLNAITLKPPFNTQGFVHVSPESPTQTELFFAREGHDMPELPPAAP